MTGTIHKDFFESIAAAGDNLFSFLLRNTGNTGEASLLFLLQIAAKTNLKKILKDTENADAIQAQLLADILQLQKDTGYGKRYHFARIRGVDEFLSIHPLTTYEGYSEAIKNITETGNFSQLVAEPITLFQETSGTTGRVKLIPRTSQFSLGVMQAFQATEVIAETQLQKSNSSLESQRGLALVNTTPSKLTPSGVPRGTGTSGGLSDALKKFKLASDLVSIKYSSPPPVFLIPDNESAYYCHLLFGLLDQGITYIAANFAANVLEAVQILEKSWPQLVSDIHRGQLSDDLNLDVETRRQLQTLLQANPSRAKELRAYFEKGFEGILPRIWPHLSYIQCITTGSMQIYSETLRRYAGAVPFYSGGYAASEAWIGINLNPERKPPAYVITPHTAFFEFIPEATIDQDQPATVGLAALKPGENYEVVVTTVAGLYRYRLGDVVRCVGYHNKSPMIEFLYRRQTLLNLLGEKVSEDVVFTALSTALNALGMSSQITDYTCRHEFTGSPWRYVLYLEAEDSNDFQFQREVLQSRIDEALCQLSDRYSDFRAAGRIGLLQLKCARPGTFAALKAQLLSHGYSDSQFKMPRLLTDVSLINFLEDKLCLEKQHEQLQE